MIGTGILAILDCTCTLDIIFISESSPFKFLMLPLRDIDQETLQGYILNSIYYVYSKHRFRTAWTNEVFHAMIMGPIYNQDMQGWVHMGEQSVRIH